MAEDKASAVLLYSRSKEFLAASDQGARCLEQLAGASTDRWRLGDLSLDALLHRVLEGDETCVHETAASERGSPFEVVATRLEANGLGRLALLSLRETGVGAEEQLRLADRERSVARLVPGAAHELRGPLTTISGLAQVLGMNESVPDDELKDALQLVQSQVMRADRLLNSLVAYARGRSAYSPEMPASLTEAVTRALELLAHDLRAGRVTVETDIDPGTPLAGGDPEELLLLTVVLIAAALAAQRRAGTKDAIAVRTGAGAGPVALLTVEHGGDPPAAAALEPARRIARHVGAEILVEESSPGRVTLITRIPGWTENDADHPPVRRLLVAEPELDAALSWLRSLAPLGLPVTLVTSAETASLWLRRHREAALLLDLDLAGALAPESLGSACVLVCPPGRDADARALARRLAVAWAPRSSAAARLSDLLRQRRAGPDQVAPEPAAPEPAAGRPEPAAGRPEPAAGRPEPRRTRRRSG